MKPIDPTQPISNELLDSLSDGPMSFSAWLRSLPADEKNDLLLDNQDGQMEIAFHAGQASCDILNNQLRQQLTEAKSYYATRLKNHDAYVEELERERDSAIETAREEAGMRTQLLIERDELKEQLIGHGDVCFIERKENERLQAECQRLRDALTEIAEDYLGDWPGRIANEALNPPEGGR